MRGTAPGLGSVVLRYVDSLSWLKSMQMTPSTPSVPFFATDLWRKQLVLVLCVLFSCLFGIYTRPIGYTAAFWPANAIMLGLLLRYPQLGQRPLSWLLSFAAFVGADLIGGSNWAVAVVLSLCNMVGVLCGWLYFSRLPAHMLNFQHQRAVLHLFAGSVVAALGAAVTGGPAGHWAFDQPVWRAIFMWMFTEFYSYIILLPILMSAPRRWIWTWLQGFAWQNVHWVKVLPLLALIVCEVMTFVLGGPGSLGFVMPAMVWCAMAYGVFPIALLNFVVSTWKTATIAMGVFAFTHEHVFEVVSFRTGIGMLTLAPLAVACAYSLRLQTLQKLNHAVNHDFLTGALARRALMERGTDVLARMQQAQTPMTVMMVDLDFFKKINDHYGHAQGDVVLQEFVALAHRHLRPDDLLGRMGGEEFAMVLPGVGRAQAVAVAQRLCEQVCSHRFPLGAGEALHVTISLGIYAGMVAEGETLEHWLCKADAALYVAKSEGRNQVRQWDSTLVGGA